MKKFTTKQGYTAYTCTAAETAYLGGMGICDDCGKSALSGFLVPVLNHYMCPDCFEKWQSSGRFYPEDLPSEARTAAYYEYRIPMDNEDFTYQEEQNLWQRH